MLTHKALRRDLADRVRQGATIPDAITAIVEAIARDPARAAEAARLLAPPELKRLARGLVGPALTEAQLRQTAVALGVTGERVALDALTAVELRYIINFYKRAGSTLVAAAGILEAVSRKLSGGKTVGQRWDAFTEPERAALLHLARRRAA